MKYVWGKVFLNVDNGDSRVSYIKWRVKNGYHWNSCVVVPAENIFFPFWRENCGGVPHSTSIFNLITVLGDNNFWRANCGKCFSSSKIGEGCHHSWGTSSVGTWWFKWMLEQGIIQTVTYYLTRAQCSKVENGYAGISQPAPTCSFRTRSVTF